MHDSIKWHLTSDEAKRVHVASLDCEIIWNAAVESVKNKNMPTELTAENGAKTLLTGEFFEELQVSNPDFNDLCESCSDECTDDCMFVPGENHEFLTQKIPVSWPTIKEIYKKIVNHYGA